MVKVSVIVPVYNAEKYLRQCLDSLCTQTLQDIEVICVDDGSTDSSLEILRLYEKADDRFKIVTQENQYASIARNNGMKYATGEYLVFEDSDNFFDVTALEKMYVKAKKHNADVCVCGANRYFDERDLLVKANIYVREEYVPSDVFNIESNPDHILNFTNESGWNKMFKRSFVEEHSLSFLPVRNGEDVYMVMRALCHAKAITTVNERLVTYRIIQKENLVGTMYKAPLDPFIAWEKTAKSLIDAGVYPKRSFVNKCTTSMVYLLRNISDRQAFNEAVAYMKENVLGLVGISPEYEDDFYDKEEIRTFAQHLCNDNVDDLLMYFAYQAYIDSTEKSGLVACRNEKMKQIKKQMKGKNELIRELRAKLDKREEKILEMMEEIERLRNQQEGSL